MMGKSKKGDLMEVFGAMLVGMAFFVMFLLASKSPSNQMVVTQAETTQEATGERIFTQEQYDQYLEEKAVGEKT